MRIIPLNPPIEISPMLEENRREKLCLDFDEDCVLCGNTPPFGSYGRCWDYDRSTGFCPFCPPWR